MSKFTEALNAATPKRGGCSVGNALAAMGADDRTEVEAAMYAPGDNWTGHQYSARAIRDALGTMGIEISKDVIQRHRVGNCSCPTS